VAEVEEHIILLVQLQEEQVVQEAEQRDLEWVQQEETLRQVMPQVQVQQVQPILEVEAEVAEIVHLQQVVQVVQGLLLLKSQKLLLAYQAVGI
tara:strand:+ start:171 stop:449 length:279 start_codon:yes stop_codon:yes gene_type:complete